MNPLARGLIAFVLAFMAYLLIFGVVGEVILPAATPKSIRLALAFAGALGAGWLVWRWLGRVPAGLVDMAMKWAWPAGLVGFVGGFLGPLLFAPQANQGPLLGIFITGPLGLLLGAVAGGLMWLKRQRGTQ